MLKKTVLLLVVSMLAITLSGCFPDGSSPYLGNSGQISDAWQLAKSIENFELDLTLPQVSPEELPILELSIREWDTEKVVGLFLGDKEITEYYEYDSDYYDGEKYAVYMSDNFLFSIEKGRILYIKYPNYMAPFTSYLDSKYETEPYDIECSFAAREEAADQVRELLDTLGITNLSEPDVKAVNAELANRIYEETIPTGNYEAWVDEEIYYISFSQVFEGVPLGRGRVGRENGYVSIGTNIKAVVDKNGIAYLNLQRIYSAEYKQGEKVSVAPATDTLKTAVSYFDGQKLLDSYTMYDCKLIYSDIANEGNMSFTLVPIWEFSCRFDFGDARESRYKVYIDYQNKPVI